LKTYYITPTRTRRANHRLAFKGGAETINFDYTAWAEDNGTVTGVTVTVESGQAAISGEALTSNVKTFVVTTAQTGKTLLKLAATDGTNTDVKYLEIASKDYQLPSTDYGLVA
jgi:hypothetical protein